MERYRVYVGAIQNVNEKIKYSCCDPTMARMLVFASRKPDGDFRTMKKSEEIDLSSREIKWLAGARLSVALANTSQSAKDAADSLNRLMDALEKELKKEKEAMTNGNQTNTEQSE